MDIAAAFLNRLDYLGSHIFHEFFGIVLVHKAARQNLGFVE